MIERNPLENLISGSKTFFQSKYSFDSYILSAFQQTVDDLLNYKLRTSDDYLSSIYYHLQQALDLFQQTIHPEKIVLSLQKSPQSNNFVITNSYNNESNATSNENLFVCQLNLYEDSIDDIVYDFSVLKEIKEKYTLQRVYYFAFFDNGVDLPLLNIVYNRLYLGNRLLLVKKKYHWVKDYLRLGIYSIKENCIQTVVFYDTSTVKKVYTAIK